jgi:aerobic carbon-monoxide dehydrogenase medium subunit
MKPASFEYYAPQTVSEAVATLAQHGYDAKALAGGQSLVPMMNFRLAQPAVLVDLNGVSELFYIRPARDGSVHMGAMTRQRQVELDPLVGQVAPLARAALAKVAYPQIRTRGTFGGSLAHADPSAELPAVAVALDARLRLQSRRGERWVAAGDFFQGFFTTLLEPDELLVEIVLPPPPPRSGWSFMEIARRHHDFALAGVATMVRLNGKQECEDVRLVYFSVGDGPMVAEQAAALLRGQVPTPEAIHEAARTAGQADVDPSSDINATAEYRRHLVEVLGRRALTEAFGRARGEG